MEPSQRTVKPNPTLEEGATPGDVVPSSEKSEFNNPQTRDRTLSEFRSLLQSEKARAMATAIVEVAESQFFYLSICLVISKLRLDPDSFAKQNGVLCDSGVLGILIETLA